jgi:hypothetical protein
VDTVTLPGPLAVPEVIVTVELPLVAAQVGGSARFVGDVSTQLSVTVPE